MIVKIQNRRQAGENVYYDATFFHQIADDLVQDDLILGGIVFHKNVTNQQIENWVTESFPYWFNEQIINQIIIN